MDKNLHDYRKDYDKGNLTLSNMNVDPFEQFNEWFKSIEDKNSEIEANAMTLATVGEDGAPKNRVVLLKEVTSKGFIFYTNYGSEKGMAIAFNNKVCISFFWPELERQVIIKGTAEKINQQKSKDYFESRPRASQLGALVSNQSKSIESRELLEKKLKELEEKFKGKSIPMPANWGGYIIMPSTFEFWQGRRSRLHDRFLYEKENNSWTIKRLQP